MTARPGTGSRTTPWRPRGRATSRGAACSSRRDLRGHDSAIDAGPDRQPVPRQFGDRNGRQLYRRRRVHDRRQADEHRRWLHQQRLPGPSVSGDSSEGGGLATLGGGLCINPEGVTSSAANLVAAGNTIAAPSGTGTGSGVEGAGVYVGCGFLGGAYHMTPHQLDDLRQRGDGRAGGRRRRDRRREHRLPGDRRTRSSPATAGGAEIGGFGASTGAERHRGREATCATSAARRCRSPGRHNICAAPLLVDPRHGDVHETAASPTIDMGANVDSPSKLAIDYYGGPASSTATGASNGARVDIGASEFHPSARHRKGLRADRRAPHPGGEWRRDHDRNDVHGRQLHDSRRHAPHASGRTDRDERPRRSRRNRRGAARGPRRRGERCAT